EFSSLKKQGRDQSSSSTSNLLQAFEIWESSRKINLERHEEQIERILNHLDELSLDRIEQIEDKIKGLGQESKWEVTIRLLLLDLEFLILNKSLKKSKLVTKMAPKRTSTSAAPSMNQATIWQLINDHVATALEAQATKMVNTNNTNRNPEPRETPAARKCTYKEFMSCQPFYFNGTEGVVGLIRWFERTKSIFSRSNCTEDCKVKFATGTLTKDALSWWNSYDKPIGIEQADKIAWSELKRLLTNKYCPRTEVKKMEDEFFNLVVKGNDLKTYVRRFRELITLCPNIVPNTEKLLEVFIGGLPRSIE
nr:reverse transcriptase domain-containing protein [Tanacetum cinerariifolium]